MADLAQVLTSTYAALASIGPPVLMDGDPAPKGSAEVIVLADVSDTALSAYGPAAPTAKRLQVTCYAPTRLRALTLTTQARTALTAAGLRFIQSRPAPDPAHIGVVSDFRR